jgi:hypothetical protein
MGGKDIFKEGKMKINCEGYMLIKINGKIIYKHKYAWEKTNGENTMIYELIKKTETIGCVFEDGADTRKTTICFLLIPTDKKDEFGEYIASECGSQDYSYQVDFKTIGFFSELELTQIEELIQDKLGKIAKVYPALHLQAEIGRASGRERVL